MIFWRQPSTAGDELMHRSNGTGIDGACLSITKTNRLDTGLKKTPSAPGQDRAEELVGTDRMEGTDGPWDDASDVARGVMTASTVPFQAVRLAPGGG
jgi:hypothetical protein